MAFKSLTRNKQYAQKKAVSVFSANLVEGEGDFDSSANNWLLGHLPPDAIITNAYVHVISASDAATSKTLKLGTAEGGGQILTAANAKTAGKQGTFAGQSLTGTGKAIYLNATASGAVTDVGEYQVVIEYLEKDKNTGEYTRY